MPLIYLSSASSLTREGNREERRGEQARRRDRGGRERGREREGERERGRGGEKGREREGEGERESKTVLLYCHTIIVRENKLYLHFLKEIQVLAEQNIK